MIDRFLLQSLRALAGLAALMLVLLAPAHADNLVTVRTGSLPALPGSAPLARVMALDGRVLALTERASWLLAADRSGWAALGWKPAGPIATSVARASDTIMLLAD
ncbi:MAG: hypothetical protein JWR56_411, partial [Massilia sp.]|nr:hypothetical protein [Massilia sp.]